jgi:hypothetical protein
MHACMQTNDNEPMKTTQLASKLDGARVVMSL